MVFIDRTRGIPPCAVCGSHVVKKNDLKIDGVRGRWKGEWTCENGHRNIIG